MNSKNQSPLSPVSQRRNHAKRVPSREQATANGERWRRATTKGPVTHYPCLDDGNRRPNLGDGKYSIPFFSFNSNGKMLIFVKKMQFLLGFGLDFRVILERAYWFAEAGVAEVETAWTEGVGAGCRVLLPTSCRGE
ncbi:hypothetical protein Dimus_038310 [Dionaea muscipula]